MNAAGYFSCIQHSIFDKRINSSWISFCGIAFDSKGVKRHAIPLERERRIDFLENLSHTFGLCCGSAHDWMEDNCRTTVNRWWMECFLENLFAFGLTALQVFSFYTEGEPKGREFSIQHSREYLWSGAGFMSFASNRSAQHRYILEFLEVLEVPWQLMVNHSWL